MTVTSGNYASDNVPVMSTATPGDLASTNYCVLQLKLFFFRVVVVAAGGGVGGRLPKEASYCL